jgi:transglutaminase-like putative cysteine protease
MNPYLAASPVIDWHAPDVLALARELRGGRTDPVAIAKAAFEWVRDEIRHNLDYGLQPLTCTASEVLHLRTGFCYAKSHLLAALLRANGIPAGLCYQRLSIDGQGAPFCLHGFNAVELPDYGWYRIDPRGNKPGIDAQFCPPREQLAFSLTLPGEHSFEPVWAEPLPVVVEALRLNPDCDALCRNLPDLAPAA